MDETTPRISHWNHRVTMTRVGSGGAEEEIYEIREVYYDEDNFPISWTVDPIAPAGDTPEELRETLSRMLQAIDHPVLDVNGVHPVEMVNED